MRWEGEGQADYGPHSYDPYYYEGLEYGVYEEPYAEDDYYYYYYYYNYYYYYCSPHRQDRCTPLPLWSGDQGRRSVRGRVDTSSLARAVRIPGRMQAACPLTGCTGSPTSENFSGEGSRGYAC